MVEIPDTFVGGYQVLGEVARGGQGAVFRARRADGAQVALNLLLDLEPESLARFEREALALAQIQHPNVVRVHDYGRDGHKPYLVMEWIEGETLSERVRRQGALSPPEAVLTLKEVATALAHCHALGTVHRDLKPQNVVLPPERGAVLVDFGLVREVRSGGGELAQRLTVTGEVLGTPSYMAPEQADASFGEVSSASDVYALGATLYFALTGYPPLELSGGLLAALVELLEGAPPDPRVRQPEVPEALAALCLRSMSKRPDQRPPHAAAFLAELEESAHPVAPSSGWAWGAGALSSLAVLVGAGFFLWGRSSVPPSPAQSPVELAVAASPSPRTPEALPSATSTPTPVPISDIDKVAKRIVQAAEVQKKKRAQQRQQQQQLKVVRADLNRAERELQAGRFDEAEAAAAGVEALLPSVPQHGHLRAALARAIDLQFLAAFKRQAPDLAVRLPDTMAKLEKLCAASPNDPGPHASLGRVHTFASRSTWVNGEGRAAHTEAAAAAYREAFAAAGEARLARGNYEVYALRELSRCARYRGKLGESQRLLEQGFAVSNTSLDCRASLKANYSRWWKIHLASVRAEGRDALRDALARRPWASERDEDQAWISELEKELRELLGP